MFLQRERTLSVKMGDFETYKFGATIGLSHHDLGITDEELVAMTPTQRKDMRDRLHALITTELSRQLTDEITETVQLSQNPKSFIHIH